MPLLAGSGLMPSCVEGFSYGRRTVGLKLSRLSALPRLRAISCDRGGLLTNIIRLQDQIASFVKQDIKRTSKTFRQDPQLSININSLHLKSPSLLSQSAAGFEIKATPNTSKYCGGLHVVDFFENYSGTSI